MVPIGETPSISGKYRKYVTSDPIKIPIAPGNPKAKTASVLTPAGKKGSSTPGAKLNKGLAGPICSHHAPIHTRIPKTYGVIGKFNNDAITPSSDWLAGVVW
jgi:hypothetical protein